MPKVLHKGEALAVQIEKNPAAAMRKVLGQNPWDKQIELARAVFNNTRVEVSGCVASTKTYAAAMVVLLWLMRWPENSRVFSIAPSFRQVDTNIWGYIPKIVHAAEQAGHPLGCKVMTVPNLIFGDGWYYEGFTTDKADNVFGIHGPHDLFIFDDFQGIPVAIMDGFENTMAGGQTHFLALHNRVVSSGPSYDVAHKEAALWAHVSISFYDMPNSDPKRKAEWIPGALSLTAVESWRMKYGEKSNFFRSKVLNEYPTAAPDTLIPLDWIEAAFTRKVNNKGILILGGDIARFGDDSSAMAPMRGREVGTVTSWNDFDLMSTTGKFAQVLQAEIAPAANGTAKSAFAFLDVVGMGGGPVDRLVELGLPVVGVDCGEAAEGMVMHGDKYRPAKDVFVNKRSQMWWNLRECLDPAAKDQSRLISLPCDLEVQAMLTAIKYRITSDGRIEVEPKSSPTHGIKGKWGLKQRLGHVLDKGDAVVLAVWGSDHAGTGGFYTASEPGQHEDNSSGMFRTVQEPDQTSPEGRAGAGQEDGLESIE